MASETPSPAEAKGNELRSALKNALITNSPQDITGIVATETPLPNCNYFVTFPDKLSKLFPGSYISPDTFVDDLGVKEKHGNIAALLGSEVPTHGTGPVFSSGYKDSDFSIKVWTGMTNTHAIRISELAKKNDLTENEEARAYYQNELFEIVKPNITNRGEREKDNRASLKYHDDCLATGDSIIGDITHRLFSDEHSRAQIMEHGVDIIIDGPATAQSVLFLKAFAQAHHFKLRMNVGYMGFGLSEKNYITYPKEILEKVNVGKLNVLNNGEGELQVVGDMGKAIQKISPEKISQMRMDLNNVGFNLLQDYRYDNYEPGNTGEYTVEVSTHKGENEGEIVYMAKGGFYCLAADRLLAYGTPETNETIIDAGRMQVEGIYGAAYYDLGKKPRDSS